MKKPLIGITPSCSDNAPQLTLSLAYLEAVETAGGIPLVLPHTASPETAAAYAALCDGFLYSGGQDLDPAMFGEAPWYALDTVSVLRDRTERCYWDAIRETGKPVLGICRGIQMVNVLRGGTLWQDLGSQFPRGDLPLLAHRQTAERWAKTHEVIAAPGSVIAQVYGERFSVNSFHHQAVREPAEGLTVTATAPDGVIEALEDTAQRFFVLVQWHPEALAPQDPASRALFRRFIEACGI